MAILVWMISIGAFLGGLGLQADAFRGVAPPLALLLYGLSALSCPVLWDNGAMRALFSGKERMMACIALLLATPVILSL